MQPYRISNKCIQVLIFISRLTVIFAILVSATLFYNFKLQQQNFSDDMIRQYSNSSLNSRVNLKLPKGMWKIKWQSPLLKGLGPQFILGKDDRILVQGSQNWQLFDDIGKNIEVANFSNSDVIIDPDHSLIYCADKNSMLTAFNLSDAKLNFILDDLYGVKYRRSFITRFENKLIVVSNEQQLDPHSSQKPDVTYIQIQIMENQVKVDDLKILINSKRGKIEKRKSAEVITAATKELLIIAYKDNIEYLDDELTAVKSFKNKFIPLAFSLDEKNNIYLIIRNEDGGHALWVVNSNGEKSFEFELPDSENYLPPCIGHNGIIYINLGNQILAIDQKSRLLWNKYTHQVTGIFALADNNLLVSEGNYVLAFDDQGERKFVFEFPEGTYLTPPFISDTGEIYIADQKNLYCLKIKD